ncbi:MAG: hypothetical protein KDC92_08195 [Bacteroidetes bacterium]|nr:hypothetical protein [Bacteroidota bacterium]
MGIVREPDGVGFEVDSRPLKEHEKNQISEIIRHYKETGEVKKSHKGSKPKKKKTQSSN